MAAANPLFTAIDAAGIAVAMYDWETTQILQANRSMEELLGLAPGTAIAHRTSDFKPQDQGQMRRELRANDGAPTRFESMPIRRRDGEPLFVDITLVAGSTDDGHDAILMIMSDASQRVSAQHQAHQLVRAVEHVADLVAVHDAVGRRLVYANRSFLEATGNVIGGTSHALAVLRPASVERLAVEAEPLLSQGLAWSGLLEADMRNGHRHLSGTLVGEVADGHLRYVTSVLTDVTEDRLQAEKMAWRASHDELTGHVNRAGLIERIETLDPASREHIAVCHLDLDRFQEINDVLGHEIGDRVIVEIARRLDEASRPDDIVARINGDEFVVVLIGVGNPDDAAALAGQLNRRVFDSPIEIDSNQITLSASIGVALSGSTRSTETLLRSADVALYRAKSLGRSHVEVSSAELQQESARRTAMIEELRAALDAGGLTVHYQPIVELVSRRIVGVEALVRWQRADGTYVPPDVFIPLAESVGLVRRIDRFVLDTAIAAVGDLTSDSAPLELHVNLSATLLGDPVLPAEVAMALVRHRYPAERLCLEITETALARDPDAAQETVAALADLGIHLALDDFGTGYSSLASLHRFRLDVIKIDRSFVHLLDDPVARHRRIVTTILRLADALDLRVVAEGIENEGQRRFFEKQGCRLAQGFLFHRPMPIEQLVRLLRDPRGGARLSSVQATQPLRVGAGSLQVGLGAHRDLLTSNGVEAELGRDSEGHRA